MPDIERSHKPLSDAMVYVLRMAESGAAFEPQHNGTIVALIKRGLVTGGPSIGYAGRPMATLTEEGRHALREREPVSYAGERDGHPTYPRPFTRADLERELHHMQTQQHGFPGTRAVLAELERLSKENARARGVLLEIASGHPDPDGHARRYLDNERNP